ncbi:alpha-N-acetylgalactosaminide alpha-2,6-sialyltransferase 5b isoform X2 [Gadus chalcogrammus]|uniref:alpha-N-acetylgalactosaminide alpha-2,6-sialyltransferase 5b isoform X2 n=1 Tax=Gadus chalcogrammus TaxID=1042646 RepID=UPI0024C4ACF9|nr:alpha-N-acetylgalactosaminide alpha-2,6-sialyltransferase 5b isoform X2 [Gadus chalcogrammus]
MSLVRKHLFISKRQGIIGVLVITTVTGFMVMYNNTSRAPSPSSSSQPGAGVILEEPPKRSTTDPITVLRGYKSFVDQKPLKMHCSSCSLVSSSGQLTGGRRGEEIDRAQCVIRMNDAPSAHFQRDVGRRTDLRVVAHSSLTRVLSRRQELLNASQDTVFIFWGPSSSMRRDGKGTMFNSLKLVKRLLPRHKLYVVSQRKMLSLDELFKNETGMDRKGSKSWLSTGWFTMSLATELCGSINVFGMVPPDFCSPASNSSTQRPSVPYHYYEPRGWSECSTYLSNERSQKGSHRFVTEKSVFASWARTHPIRFQQPDWTPRSPAPDAMATNTSDTRQLQPVPDSRHTDVQINSQIDRQASRQVNR